MIIGLDLRLLRANVTLLKHLFVTQPQLGVVDRAVEEISSKLKVPELEKFKGARLAKDLKKFIWDMQEYFVAVKIYEHKYVPIASMFKTGMPNYGIRHAPRNMSMLVATK